MSTRLNEVFANFKTTDLETMIADLDTQLKVVLNEMAPERTKAFLVRPTNPWFTEEVKIQKRLMRNREQQWRKYKLQSNRITFKAKHNKYRAMLQSIRKSTLSDKVNDCNSDTKKLYAFVNGIIGRASENPMPKRHCDDQLAEEFADYFMAKIKKICDSLKNYPPYKPVHWDIKLPREFQPLAEQKMSKTIGKMASKACEIDPIPTKILKRVLPSVIGPITSIVSNSITTGIFAHSWKTAIVHPILKEAGLALQLSNFRPVSNLSFLSHVVECPVLKQFNKHCKDHDLIPYYQSAYRVYYTCETAIVKIVNDILSAMENQRVTTLMAVDLSATFDTVDHSILISVLRERFGITEMELSWFESYLHLRYCKVSVGTTYSKNRELVCSVPQGSCAGPILYMVYASTIESVVVYQTSDHEEEEPSQFNGIDLKDRATAVTLHGFTDDHALKNTFAAKSRQAEKDSVSNLEAKAADVKVWMDQNCLKMNKSKTEFIMCAFRLMLQKYDTTKINVNGSNIQCSDIIKYLGAWLDQHLQLVHHITLKCRTTMINFQKIKLIQLVLNTDVTHTLVRGLVTSHLDYCNVIF